MDQQVCRAAKAQLIDGMKAGQSWQEAAEQAGVQTSRTFHVWIPLHASASPRP
jgi:hypothetical protein